MDETTEYQHVYNTLVQYAISLEKKLNERMSPESLDVLQEARNRLYNLFPGLSSAVHARRFPESPLAEAAQRSAPEDPLPEGIDYG